MLHNITYKHKANALQFVVYLVVIIAILLSMLLLYIHLNNRFMAQSNSQIEAIELADQGIHQSLGLDFLYNDTLVLDDSENKNIKLIKKHWGIFDLVQSFSKVRDKSFQKVALVGGQTPFDESLSLYLQENNQALVLVGDTELRGNAYLGAYGVKPGQISGKGYINNQLVYGNIKNSGFLPRLPNEKQNHLISIIKRNLQDLGDLEYFQLDSVTNFQQSFYKPLAYHYARQPLYLYGKSISGQVMIQSDTRIYVDASCKLEDVVLIAPMISIGQGVKGNFQAFASKKIEVESGVNLSYPSALVLIPESDFEQNSIPQLILKSNAEIQGSIAYLKGDNSQLETNTFSHILIEDNAKVYGQLYCHYNTELSGQVFGHVITNQFLTPYRGSYYLNHLLDTKIQAEPVSNQYSGLPFQSEPKSISSWVN